MLRMNLHLVDTQHGRNIWSERYDGGIDDLFTMQAED
jgi:TolB-like protein